MTDWKEYRLGDLCKNVMSGGTPLTSNKDYYENGNIPWLKTTEIHKEIIRYTDTYITELGLKNSSAKLIPENSLIVAMYGDGGTAGKVALTKISLTTNQACCNLVIDKEKAFYGFVYYYLKVNYENLVNLKTGGSQQNLNAIIIKNFKIRVPNIETQQKIANILGSYDELIEVNNQRIKTLEGTAQALYKEWFVRFRFPDYQNTEFIKGIPKGWEVVKLGDLVKVNAINAKLKGEEEIYYIDISSVSSGQINNKSFYIYNDAPGRAKRIVKNGDIIFSTVRPENRAFAMILNAENNLIVSTGFAVLTPNKNISSGYIYFTVSSNVFIDEMINKSKGSAYPQVGFDDIKNYKILNPKTDLMAEFNEIVVPIFDQIETLQQQNTELRQIRDRLLPRLISGKITV